MANVDLPRTGFPDSYLMLSKRDKDRCYLVDRRDSTVRRSRKNLPGRTWRVKRFGSSASGSGDHWLLRSKRKGTVFFVPVEEVSDWSYPFLYDVVRREIAPELPAAGWTQLFQDRVYRGLYLRLDLPFDARKKDGGSGVLREILTVRGPGSTVVDTRFNPDARLYADLIADGVFPRLREPAPAIAWLARRRSLRSSTLLLHNAEPFDVSLLPLPMSLDELATKLHGEPLAATLDERFRRWTGVVAAVPEEPPFEGALRETLEDRFEEYVSNLEAALAAHRTLHRGSPDPETRPPLTLERALALPRVSETS